jgi:hypothetical protein
MAAKVTDSENTEASLHELIDGIMTLPAAAEQLQISYQQPLQLLHERNLVPPYSIADVGSDLFLGR